MTNNMPENFVFLSDIDPTIIENVRYYTNQNFLGTSVTGYESKKIVCTKEASEQLKNANEFFKQHGYKLVVYDGYRPQMAVDHFKAWGDEIDDDIAKKYYYPTLDKKDLFKLGFLAEDKSMHSRGSTFDLTLIEYNQALKQIVYSKRNLLNGDEITFLDDNTVDMGSSFDLFHKVSYHDSKLINSTHAEMRNILREGMKQFGFKEYKEEWWHYTLENEPYPDTYFNFIVKK